MQGTADVGVVGLGTMGSNLALNLEEKGFRVAVFNRRHEVTAAFAAEHTGARFVPTSSLEELAACVEPPRRIFLMVKAGEAVDAVLEALAPHLEEGDAPADGGNSHFEDTERRQARLAEKGIQMLGVGVSGGASGARHGPSLMPGGPKKAYERWRDVFEKIAARTPDGPCVAHLGPGGAGHFVKMVHNGIEYADMEVLAEVYDLLVRALGLPIERAADVFERWNEGPLASFLVEITARILRVRDEDGAPLVERVLDAAEQKGTGRWTVVEALRRGVEVPTIAAAVDARVVSSRVDLRRRLARKWRPPKRKPAPEKEVETLEAAALFGRIVALAEGMDLIGRVSDEMGWGVERSEVARIWKGGCIIRSRLLDLVQRAFRPPRPAGHLFEASEAMTQLKRTHRAARRTVRLAIERGVPAPGLSAALAHADALGSARLPQALTQAQRDAFGAHTYLRVDRPGEGPFHTEWLGSEP